MRGGLESKGEGSWFQERGLSGWEFDTLSKASVFHVSVFSYIAQGVTPGYINYLCDCIRYKDRILVRRLKINHARSTPSCVNSLETISW